MNKLKNKKEALIVAVASAILWIVIVLLFNNYNNGVSWVNFGFGIVSYSILIYLVVCSDAYMKRNVSHELYGPTIYYALLYTYISSIFNAVCMFASYKDWAVIIVVNLVLIAVLAVFVLFSVKHATAVSMATEKIADSIEKNRDIKKDVQNILLGCDDETIKKELKDLKELVEYSDRMGRSSSRVHEERFVRKLDEIKVMIHMKASQEEVVTAIKEAANIWKQRNMNL